MSLYLRKFTLFNWNCSSKIIFPNFEIFNLACSKRTCAFIFFTGFLARARPLLPSYARKAGFKFLSLSLFLSLFLSFSLSLSFFLSFSLSLSFSLCLSLSLSLTLIVGIEKEQTKSGRHVTCNLVINDSRLLRLACDETRLFRVHGLLKNANFVGGVEGLTKGIACSDGGNAQNILGKCRRALKLAKICRKTNVILPKCQNFAQSGHTGPLTYCFVYKWECTYLLT